jgi:transposase
MIPVPSGVKVWIATGVTDLRRGMNGLSLMVQEAFGRDPHLCVERDYVAAP